MPPSPARKIIANVVCGFIPSKFYRNRVRRIILLGVIRYIRAIRREPGLKFRYYLSVVAIVKDEAPYFKEWIEYHRLVGVEKFYIYDNESSDDTREVLRPYIDAGIVEYTFYPGDKMQNSSYMDAVSKHKLDTKWLAVIDLDEFIVPVETDTIPEFLRSLPQDVSQLLIGWMIYGSSGHKTKPDGLVIENYKYRGSDDASVYGKPIVNPRMVANIFNTHFFNTVNKTVDEDGAVELCRPNRSMPKRKIRINHYPVKSHEEFLSKARRGDVASGRSHTKDENYFKGYDKNEIYDPIMDKYVGRLKKIGV